MQIEDDFIHLAYTPDMTQAGIQYACRSLAYTYDRMGGSPFERMRRIVAGKAVELAFRRHLSSQDIPHDNLGATHFTEPDHYDVALGGRRCDLKSFLIFHKSKISRLRQYPGLLLQAAALVPDDQLFAEHHSDQDLYIFAFVLALVTPDFDTLQQARQAGQPVHLVLPLPAAWAQPETWAPLGRLALKNELAPEVTVELGGQDSQHGFITESLQLPPGRRIQSNRDFHSLAYLHAPELPAGRVGISAPRLGEAHLAATGEWGNIWVYGIETVLAGWMRRGEFRQHAKRLPQGSRTFLYPRTRTPNRWLPVAQLHPMQELFEYTRRWKHSL